MKKKILTVTVIALLAIILPVLLIACDKQNKEYNITVLSPTDEPIADLTVSWMVGNKVAGSAKTDAEGKATATLAAGTYAVVIEGFDEKFDYTDFSVTATMLDATVNLSIKRIDYVTTVTDKTGAPAAGVTVNWVANGVVVGTAATGADGKATKQLDYGQYSVTLSALPDGNVYNGAKTVSGTNPSVDFALRNGVQQQYSVTVKSEGGLLFKKQPVLVFIEGDDLAYDSGETDENGKYVFNVEAGNYTVVASNLPNGYTGAEAKLTVSDCEKDIILHSEVITTDPANSLVYVLGDIIHDYGFTTPYNMQDTDQPWSGSIAEILKTKKAIIINNWGVNCSWCVTEMPDMQDIYEKYSDDIEMIAVNNFSNAPDTDKVIDNFRKSHNLTFPMMRDTNGLSFRFALTNWPTTVIIDRYGAIARIEVGAVLGTEAWERMILKYIGDDYVQTFTPGDRVSESINNEIAKPDVTLDDDHYTTKVPGVLYNASTLPANTSITWRGETEYEYAWPFVIGNDQSISATEYLCASNVGKPQSMAIIYADITVNAGQVLVFDYYTDCEANDVLSFVWDGKIIRQISGLNNSKGWQTCHLYSELIDGDHTLAIAYTKNSWRDEGTDNVYLRNLRFVGIDSITDTDEPVDMLRSAAYGQPNAGDTRFPHYADVYLAQDGYYHVRLSQLQNAGLAGNDEDPLLLVNLMNVTTWSPKLSLNELILGVNEAGEYVTDCRFDLGDGVVRDYRNELTKYIRAASASDVVDMAPVDQRLHDMLVEFMKKLSVQYWHNDEWLEVCFFYSHYGSGEPIGNPIMGLMTETAIVLDENVKTTADLTRLMAPFPTMIYTFTPAQSGLYKLESFIPDKDAEQYWAQIWLYDDETDPDHALAYSGSDRIRIDAINEQNFELYCNLEANHKYYVEVSFLMMEMGTYEFSITRQQQDVTVWEPASADDYVMILDPNDPDKIIGNKLAGAVNYELYTDGYYRVKNADGSWGEYIYLDVLQVNTAALGSIPLNRLVDMEVQDPKDYTTKLGYKYFDFSHCVMYFNYTLNGEQYTGYLPNVDLSENGERYKDYTDILKGYIADAPTTGEYKGLIKVNKELADILNMFFEMRLNGIWAEVSDDGNYTIEKYEIETALENEWLRFCWYQHTYKADNE